MNRLYRDYVLDNIDKRAVELDILKKLVGNPEQYHRWPEFNLEMKVKFTPSALITGANFGCSGNGIALYKDTKTPRFSVEAATAAKAYVPNRFLCTSFFKKLIEDGLDENKKINTDLVSKKWAKEQKAADYYLGPDDPFSGNQPGGDSFEYTEADGLRLGNRSSSSTPASGTKPTRKGWPNFSKKMKVALSATSNRSKEEKVAIFEFLVEHGAFDSWKPATDVLKTLWTAQKIPKNVEELVKEAEVNSVAEEPPVTPQVTRKSFDGELSLKERRTGGDEDSFPDVPASPTSSDGSKSRRRIRVKIGKKAEIEEAKSPEGQGDAETKTGDAEGQRESEKKTGDVNDKPSNYNSDITSDDSDDEDDDETFMQFNQARPNPAIFRNGEDADDKTSKRPRTGSATSDDDDDAKRQRTDVAQDTQGS